jgi:hypothetical protein
VVYFSVIASHSTKRVAECPVGKRCIEALVENDGWLVSNIQLQFKGTNLGRI